MSRKADYGGWTEKVIGSNRVADPDHRRSGSYGYFEKRTKWRGLTVVAQVYPFVGTTSPDGPHAWGVRFPAQTRLTKFDPRTNGTIETRAYAPERRFGSKADSRDEAMRQADECVLRGGWDSIEREPNGTLSALKPEPTVDETYDDIPEGW
jgi:hypothetical protein